MSPVAAELSLLSQSEQFTHSKISAGADEIIARNNMTASSDLIWFNAIDLMALKLSLSGGVSW